VMPCYMFTALRAAFPYQFIHYMFMQVR
jgi:hypothetical protein